MSARISTTQSIPFLFRHAITTIEPLLAIGGAVTTYFAPAFYISMSTRGMHTYTANTKFLYTTIAGSWLHWTFLEAVVLRSFDDVRLWRLSCAGMLLNDIFYCIACAEAVGGWAEWSRVGKWTSDDWGVVLLTVPFVAARVCIVLGIGLQKTKARITAGRDSSSSDSKK